MIMKTVHKYVIMKLTINEMDGEGRMLSFSLLEWEILQINKEIRFK